jgi:hypothetical protein
VAHAAASADRELGRSPRHRGLAAFAASVAFVLPLIVYWPTPGDYWIRIDNERLIRDAPTCAR